jgi:hypothetical protein
VPENAAEEYGPLALLPGRWHGNRTGWNLIALPFATDPPPAGFNFRLLLNQYSEDLVISTVDTGVLNRGLRPGVPPANLDQLLVALDYEQVTTQVAAEDFPPSGRVPPDDLVIHHEPGLWLHMRNEQTDDLDIARLCTVPHGDSVLAMGRSASSDGPAPIPVLNGLPLGVAREDLSAPFLAPYRHFIDRPFRGTTPPFMADFPGFHPLNLNALLEFENRGLQIERSTTLELDTTLATGGVLNIPFVARHANATAMRATFWILEYRDADGKAGIRLQYSQNVLLEFAGPRSDGMPGPIRWPHVCIGTLDKLDPL